MTGSGKKLRAAAYCRVSTDKDDQLNSLETQRSFFLDFIREKGWELAGIFADEGLSGTSVARRPEFNRMLALAEEGGLDLIVTKEVSRFARNTVDALSVTRKLKSRGVGVLFLNDGIDTRDNDGEFRLTIMASVAQEESRKISERTRWGQAQAMKRGVVFGNDTIYGYTLQKGRLTVNPEQAEVVRQVYHKFLAERKGTFVIARELTEKGVDPPLRSGEAWSSTMVLRILRNEKYCGSLLQHKYRTLDYLSHRKVPNDGVVPQLLLENHHEAIVTPEQYRQAQEELQRRQSLTGDRKRFSARYWYSGKVVCGCCGRTMEVKRTRRGNGKEYKCFVCRSRSAPRKPGANEPRCSMRGINARIVEVSARHVLQQLALDREVIICGVLTELMELRGGQSTSPSEPEKLKQAIQRQKNRRQRALDAYLDGSISREDWVSVSKRCDTEIQKLTSQLDRQGNDVGLLSMEEQFRRMRELLEAELDGGPCVLEEAVERITVEQDHLIVRLSGMPVEFLVRAEGRGSGRGYHIVVTECTPVPLSEEENV